MAQADLPSFHGIIGRSPAMLALFRRIGRVALFDVPVLIRGETGTGKEIVTRAIWQLGARRDRRFETVNAGALNRELLISGLFGHERGAFTGAVARKPGLLALADGGTVFLDEVGDLPLDAQVMLLRFLQSGEIRPVGSTETGRVNVRLIAATHRDLEAAVERGTFREDLYYRLRRVVLEVPPLRVRREDIPLLVEHIRVQVNQQYGLAIDGVTPRALALLGRAPWRGNVRELEAIIEQAMIFRDRGWVGLEDLDLPVLTQRKGARASPAGAGADILSWCQDEALRMAATGRGVRRRDLIARCGVSREVARRELARLVHTGALQRVGRGRGTRYVPSAPAPSHSMDSAPRG